MKLSLNSRSFHKKMMVALKRIAKYRDRLPECSKPKWKRRLNNEE